MKKYKARKMFKGGGFYVEFSDGSGHRDWLKDKDVPNGLRHLLVARCREESAECPSWAYARSLARGMAWEDSEARRNALVSSKRRGDREITYGEWRGWAHSWRRSRGRLLHSRDCFCGIPEPRISKVKV